jgi:hypothetical protein
VVIRTSCRPSESCHCATTSHATPPGCGYALVLSRESLAKGRDLIHKGVSSATRVHELTLDPPRLVIIHEAHDLDGKFHV